MADPIDLMIMLAEAKELARADSEIEQHLTELEGEVNAALARYKFTDIESVKANMALPITRIVQARKIALQQLASLASREAIEQLDD